MKSSINNSVMMHSILVMCFIVIILQAFSLQDLGRETILRFDVNHPVFRADARPLMESVTMINGSTNPLFLSGVGGVSFDQVAVPLNNLKISNLKLIYNINATDGKRLELMINKKPVNLYLPDWMLVPIAKYADSRYYSCVTLFGKLTDKNREKQVLENKGRVINYHPAFDNTLMGIRLAYMDMLVSYKFANDLPKNSQGEYLLGTGEVQPDLEANRNGAFYLSQHIIKTENKYDATFRSYVISDFTRQIIFNIQGDSLTISGTPYYFCWKFNSDRKDYDINKVAQRISTAYNQRINQITQTSGNLASREWIINKIISLSHKYSGKYGFYSEGTFLDLTRITTDVEKRKFLSGYATESLFEMIVQTEAYMDKDSVVYLRQFSDDISRDPALIKAANPAVWNATVKTMRYSAFFRYVKTHFPNEWLAFSNQIKTIDPEPRIKTPTILNIPGNNVVKKQIQKNK